MPPQRGGKKSFSSLGSGFIIHKDGYLITNNHVVEKATKITVKFRDEKKRYEAKLIGQDEKTDIALLKVEVPKSVKLTPVVLGNSDDLVPGDWVIAIGNPFRLGHTATVGIVSAKSRRNVGGPYTDFIQTDASINPGNSGGPLFNARGEVIGINTAIFSRGGMGSSGFNIGIGFAIPINIAKGVIAQLHEKGHVTRGWLGVLIQAVTPDAADALGLDSPRGALVADVIEDSPAAKAGLQRRDVIVSYDGQEVEENDDLPQMVGRTVVGKSVPVTVIRDGKEVSISVEIAELKEAQVQTETEEKEASMLGMSIQDITPDIAKGLDLKAMDGVVVTDVSPDSAADRAGIRRGDVILEVDSKPTNSSDDFRVATQEIPKNKPLLMLVRRGAHTLFFTLKVE
jgi:serine protease Do